MHALKRLFTPVVFAVAVAVVFCLLVPYFPGNRAPVTDVPGDRAPVTDDTAAIPLPEVGAKTPQKAMTPAELLRLSGKIAFSPAGYTAEALAAAGFTLSSEPYDAGHTVLLRTEGISLPKSYDAGVETYTAVQYVRPDEMSAPEPVYETLERPRLAVEPYMGYLLLSDGETMQILNATGEVLFTAAQDELVPLNARDTAGNPLFYAPEAVGLQTFSLDENGALLLSDYDDSVHGRGVRFDYAPSFGVSDNSLCRLVKREYVTYEKLSGTVEEFVRQTWAYGYSASWRRTGYTFAGAYDFSEGMAAVVDEDGYLNYIGENGYYAFYPRKNFYYYDRYVTEYYLPPLTDGEESIGFYYYDHGLVRVRRQVVDWYGITYIDTLRVAVDEDILIDKTGKEFPVPDGYDIVSYSDGVILLTKDGKYGYMDYTGKWIAQPIYDHARPFFEGLAVAGFADGTRLMLDTKGNIVIPAGLYTHISDVSSGVIAAYSQHSGWDVYHKMAKVEG